MSNCLECTSATRCTTCRPNYFVKYDRTSCVTTCGDGFYGSPSDVCLDCNSHCATCYLGGIDQCFSCQPDYLINASTTTCRACSTVPGYALNSSNMCVQCGSGCSACVNSTMNCTSCNSGNYLYQNACPSPCPTTTFINGLNCSACGSNCDVCTSASTCTTCTSPYKLSSGACYSVCPSGTRQNDSNLSVCDSCSVSNCASCPVTIATCTACNSGLVLNSN